MMLADPRRMKTDLLGVNRPVEDIGDELVRLPPVVVVVVVAQREIAESHPSSRSHGNAPAIKNCTLHRLSLHLQRIYEVIFWLRFHPLAE